MAQNNGAPSLAPLSEEDKEFFRSLPPGYRFLPTDEELVVEYLMKEVDKKPLPRHKIQSIDIYKYNPQLLCQRDEVQREKQWYFFSPRDRKYPNGCRPTRKALGGFWKPTGIDTPIRHRGDVVGYKKSLDFYAGHHQKPIRTNWKMHEYRILEHPQPVTKTKEAAPNNMELDVVLCKIYENAKAKKEVINIDESGVHQAANGADDQNNHFYKDQHQQLQRLVEPSNLGGGVTSFFMNAPVSSTADSFVIHENGQGDGTMNSDQGEREDYPFNSISFNGIDELSVLVDEGRRLHHAAEKKS